MIPSREVAAKIESEEHLAKIERYEVDLDIPSSAWAKTVKKEQHGKTLHGDLVAATHRFLVDELGHYSTYKKCVGKVHREDGFLGSVPDVYDPKNKIIIECGFNHRFSDDTFSFLIKVCKYIDQLYMIDDFDLTEWTFMHFPKSIEDGDPALLIEFNNKFRELVEREDEKHRSNIQQYVNELPNDWLSELKKISMGSLHQRT